MCDDACNDGVDEGDVVCDDYGGGDESGGDVDDDGEGVVDYECDDGCDVD